MAGFTPLEGASGSARQEYEGSIPATPCFQQCGLNDSVCLSYGRILSPKCDFYCHFEDGLKDSTLDDLFTLRKWRGLKIERPHGFLDGQ